MATASVDRSRRAAEVTQRTAETPRYRRLYDLGPQPILTVDRDWRLVDANPAAVSFLSVVRDELVGRHVSSLVAGSDRNRDRIVEQVHDASPVRAGRFTTAVTDGAGAERPVEVTVVPIAEGPERGAFLILDDVTDRFNVRRKLDAGERRFRTLIDNLSDHALLLIDRAGVISTWNRTARRLTGQLSHDAIGLPARDLFDEPDGFDALLRDAARLGRAERELRSSGPDGDRRVLACATSSIVDDAGEVRAFASVIIDVTARRRAEQAMAASEERFRLVAEHARDGIYRIRLHPGFAYEYVNPALVDITGVRPESLYGDPDLPLRRIHPDDRALVRTSRADSDTADWPLEIRWNRDGSWRHLSVTEVALHDDAGDVVAIQGFVIDVTDERQRHAALEETLRREQVAVERLRDLDSLKKAFLQAVSHELRTPLTSIMGYAQTLHSRDGELAPETRHRLLERLDHNAQRLARLLDDLLDLDRLQGGIVKLHRSHTDLAQIVLNVAGEHHSPDRPIDVLPDGDLTVAVDASKVERIVDSLLANAVDHTPPGTHIAVHVTRQDARVLLVVEDDGPGIDENLLDTVFEPFQQGDDSLDRASPGTGIGLALVRQHARLHGGDAWARQRPDGGTRMHVNLPIPAPSADQAPGTAPRHTSTRPTGPRHEPRLDHDATKSVNDERPRRGRQRARKGQPMEHADIRSARRWELLASTIRTRMTQLDLNRQELAARTGISAAVIGDLATGTPKNYRPNTLTAVAQGLDWHPLAPVAVLAGDEAAASLGIHLPSGPLHHETTTEHAHIEAAA